MANPSLNEEEVDSLREQYNNYVSLKIMALHSKGTSYEKLEKYGKAIALYKEGKHLVEQTFGSNHELYAVFSSAMGGAKLKTKYS